MNFQLKIGFLLSCYSICQDETAENPAYVVVIRLRREHPAFATLFVNVMELGATGEIGITKPVACRLSFSSFRSFSKLLSCTDDASPPPPDIPEAAVAIIKPTTLRFRPNCNRDVAKAGLLDSAPCHPSKMVNESSPKNNVVYKPIAKLASRRALSSLANMGGQAHGFIPTREMVEVESGTQQSNQVYSSSEILETQKQQMTNPSSDQHNWRKYGQKPVKGSEYPRSYYKCTYPNCPVKKKVEKRFDGHIEEMVYEGEHNHTTCKIPCKPLPDLKGQKTRNSETQSEAKIQKDCASSSSESTAQPTGDLVTKTGTATSGLGGECEKVPGSVGVEGDDFQSKRRRKNRLIEASTSGDFSSEPQKNLVHDNNDDFRWRKYGQKVVKGNPHARSYYKCTNPECGARKYVERTQEDPGTFITIYEGRHNHGIPIRGTNLDIGKTNTRKKS